MPTSPSFKKMYICHSNVPYSGPNSRTLSQKYPEKVCFVCKSLKC